MLGPQAGIARLVLPFMVVAECIASRFRRGLVKPALWKDTAHGLYSHHRGAAALIWHRLHAFELGFAQMVHISLAADIVFVHTVMRQMTDRLLIAARAQLIDVVGEHLPNTFQVIEPANLLPDPFN